MQKIIKWITIISFGFCMIVSPVVSLLTLTGLVKGAELSDTWVFHVFTVIGVFLWFRYSGKLQKKTRIMVNGAIVAVIVLCMLPGIYGNIKADAACRKAIGYIESGNYEAAWEYLSPYSYDDHRGCLGLWYLSRAHISFEDGRYEEALAEAELYEYYTPRKWRLDDGDAFLECLDANLETFQDERREKEQQALEAEIRTGLPFVGMPESAINDTLLGEHCGEVRHNTEMIDGDVYTANLYDFYQFDKRIFSARCVNGVVTEVWDKRDEPDTYTPSRKKTSGNEETYNVHDYSDPDDFYYDNYDDFYDYEDAEDYFYEHAD